MGDDNLRDKEVVEDIINQVWKCTNILYKGGKLDSARVVLFLISTYKDGLFPSPYINDPKNTIWLEEYFNKLQGDPFYNKICNIYDQEIAHLHYRALDEVIHQLNQVNRDQLEENYTEIFESLLKKYIDFEGKRAGEIIQPKEISKLIINLANLQPNAKVYNPFAGLASFAILLEENQEYHGQEINSFTWAIGQLRLKAHNVGYTNDYLRDDSINHWPESQMFDLVVASPPFFVPIPDHFHSQFSEEPFGKVQNFLIEKGIQSLNDKGQLISVFPLSFLIGRSRREKKLKKWLVQNNLIDTVIVLPSGLLSNTGVTVCIVIIKKVSENPGYVRMIDASSFFIKDGTRKKTLNDQDLFQLINTNSENEFLRYVNASEVSENEYDLSVGRYLIKNVIQGIKSENVTLKKLSKFTQPIKGEKVPQNSRMRQVQIRELKDDIFDCILSSDELELSPVKRATFRIIEETCVLIATRWNTLKPTYFKYTGEPIVISRAIVALKVDKNQVDPLFLINEFSKDYVKKQLDGYRTGTVQPILRSNDLKKVVFKLPQIQEQRAKVSGITEISSKLKKLELEKEKLIGGIKKGEIESSTSLSHVLGKPLLSIGSSLEIIQSTLNKLDSNWKDIIINERRQFRMSDAFDSIFKNVKYIQELVDENTTAVTVSSFKLTEIRFLKFLSNFVRSERKSLNGDVELILDIHDDIKQEMGNQVLIMGNEQKLRIVFVNLIDNAKNHAFIKGGKDFKIYIEILPFVADESEALNLNYEIDPKKSYVEIKVFNSGKPFPKDFTLDDYIRKNFSVGVTKNKGLGGYEINEILKVHNSGKKALNIMSLEESQEYSSMVSFIIPII